MFTVGGTSATEFEVAPKSPADASLCQGDAGGPALRTGNGAPALVAVTSRSWQGGCLGGTATRTGAFESRTDGPAPWVRATTNRSVRMAPGQELLPGRMPAANDARVLMQTDGNPVMYHNAGGGALWASGTHGNPGAYAVMRTDGNFVLYAKDGGPATGGALWNTGTFGTGFSLVLRDDGDLVISGADGRTQWSSGTAL